MILRQTDTFIETYLGPLTPEDLAQEADLAQFAASLPVAEINQALLWFNRATGSALWNQCARPLVFQATETGTGPARDPHGPAPHRYERCSAHPCEGPELGQMYWYGPTTIRFSPSMAARLGMVESHSYTANHVRPDFKKIAALVHGMLPSATPKPNATESETPDSAWRPSGTKKK